jgi:hypothetical protein
LRLAPFKVFKQSYTFRSLFGQTFGLRNHLGDVKVFDLIFD